MPRFFDFTRSAEKVALKSLISKSMIIKRKISLFFHLLEQYSYFLLARISMCCFFQDQIHYQRNIRNLCASIKDVCKRGADEWSYELTY